MRSETHWSYGNWIAWGLGMAWALGITALGASHAPLAQQGGAQFGQFFGPLCVIGLAAMALLKRRYLELGEKGLVDCGTLITHTYAYENIQRVASFPTADRRQGVIVIDCEVGGVIRRIRMSATQDRWPTLVAHLWRRLPLLQVDLAPETVRRVQAIRDDQPLDVRIAIPAVPPLKYDLARTYGGHLLVALPAMLIVSLFSGGAAILSFIVGACFLVPVLVAAGLIDYVVARQSVHFEFRPDGFGYRDHTGMDFWIPWGELTAIGFAGGLGSSLTWIHAREKTILIRGHLVAMQQVRWTLAEAMRVLDATLAASPGGPVPPMDPPAPEAGGPTPL